MCNSDLKHMQEFPRKTERGGEPSRFRFKGQGGTATGGHEGEQGPCPAGGQDANRPAAARPPSHHARTRQRKSNRKQVTLSDGMNVLGRRGLLFSVPEHFLLRLSAPCGLPPFAASLPSSFARSAYAADIASTALTSSSLALSSQRPRL